MENKRTTYIYLFVIAVFLVLGSLGWNWVMPLFGLPQLSVPQFTVLWFVLHLLIPTGYNKK